MPTKGASDRWEACKLVVSSLRENKPRLVDKLTALMQENLPEGRAVPDFGEQIDLVADTLEHSGARMIASDQAYLDELGDDVKYREVRDAAHDALNAKYISQRDIYTGAFGTALAREVGFDPVTDENPKRFLLQVRRVKEKLESPDFVVPELDRSGITFDPVGFAQDFEPEYTTLLDAHNDLLRERREADTMVIAKKKDMDLYDHWFRFGAGFGETSMRLVGMTEEAERVRPSLRRPGRTAAQAEADRRGDPAPGPGEDEAGEDGAGEDGAGEGGAPDSPPEEPPPAAPSPEDG